MRTALIGPMAAALMALSHADGEGRIIRERFAPPRPVDPGKRLDDPPREGRPFRRDPVTGLKLRA